MYTETESAVVEVLEKTSEFLDDKGQHKASISIMLVSQIYTNQLDRIKELEKQVEELGGGI